MCRRNLQDRRLPVMTLAVQPLQLVPVERDPWSSSISCLEKCFQLQVVYKQIGNCGQVTVAGIPLSLFPLRGRVSFPSPWIRAHPVTCFEKESEAEMTLCDFWGWAAKDLQLLPGHLTCDGYDPLWTTFHEMLAPSLFSLLPLTVKWTRPSHLVPILFIRTSGY